MKASRGKNGIRLLERCGKVNIYLCLWHFEDSQVSFFDASSPSELKLGRTLMRKNILWAAASLLVSGCASWQLNYNTEEVAGTVERLIKDQIVLNLGRFLVDPQTIPTQVAIPTGSVTTTNQLSASWTDPLSRTLVATQQFVRSATPSITGIGASTYAASTITSGANNQASQNWALSPIGDADPLRRLRALYRYATSAPGANLCREYPLMLTSVPTQAGANSIPAAFNDAPKGGDVEAWKSATDADVSAVYSQYLRTFPDGKHKDAARWRQEQIKEGKKLEGEELVWRNAILNDSANSYETFLKTEKKVPIKPIWTVLVDA